MQVEGSVEVKAPREVVFHSMMDPGCLSQAVPGCEQLTLLGPSEYAMTIKIGIAAVKGTYSGRIRLDEIVTPEGYRMTIEGSSGIGIIKGVGNISLVEGDGNTKVLYNGNIQVSGKIASVGNRFLGTIAKMLIGKFFDGMAKQIHNIQPKLGVDKQA